MTVFGHFDRTMRGVVHAGDGEYAEHEHYSEHDQDDFQWRPISRRLAWQMAPAAGGLREPVQNPVLRAKRASHKLHRKPGIEIGSFIPTAQRRAQSAQSLFQGSEKKLAGSWIN